MCQALWYLIFFLSTPSKTLGQDDSGWCYEGSCGPKSKSWTGICQTGKAQSPISIIPSTTKKVARGRNLIFSADYFAVNSFEIMKTGHTVTITQQRTGGGSLQVKGAGWNGTYDFLEMNLHWGSEHLVKGIHSGNINRHEISWRLKCRIYPQNVRFLRNLTPSKSSWNHLIRKLPRISDFQIDFL